MTKKPSCWEVLECENGPESDSPCVVVDHTLSDGYLGGENGSRACFYIKGTSCFEDDKNMDIVEKLERYCLQCKFFRQVMQSEGVKSNLYYYVKFLHNQGIEDETVEELPLFNNEIFSIA